jgi:hypothetical protein
MCFAFFKTWHSTCNMLSVSQNSDKNVAQDLPQSQYKD